MTNPNWKTKLQQILDEHNNRHARLPKDVSFRTRDARASALFLVFGQLRELGFQPDPSNLGGTHIENLIWYWTGDQRIAERCGQAGVPMRDEPVSPAYLQFLASTLRTFSAWIGKPGMVLPLERYVPDPSRYQRSGIATHDKSWTAKGLDIPRLLELMYLEDIYVGTQVELIFALGLRRKESIMLRPHLQVIPASLVPGYDVTADHYLMVVELRHGTKGGRLRFVPLESDVRRLAIEHAQRLVPHPNDHMGRPGHTLKQSLRRFDYVMDKVGVTRAELEITAHGLRHQFANDMYVELTGNQSLVRGGVPSDLLSHYDACMKIVQQLGHARPQIAGAYLGPILNSIRHARPAPGNSDVHPATQVDQR